MVILRRGIYAQTHRHHTIQITFAMDGVFEAELDHQCHSYKGLVIASDYPHRVIGQEGWVATLTLNPETKVAKAVQQHLLEGVAYRSVEVEGVAERFKPALERDLSSPELFTILMFIRDALLPKAPDAAFSDARITDALNIARQTEDYKIGAKALSEQVYLSESRLGHLFKEEVGIPLRRYLLWNRLMLAAQHIAQGATFTFAAHEAGFTDSAHLSRTFYAMFGIRPSDMFGKPEDVRVIFLENN